MDACGVLSCGVIGHHLGTVNDLMTRQVLQRSAEPNCVGAPLPLRKTQLRYGCVRITPG
jgi:hypothetical protein